MAKKNIPNHGDSISDDFKTKFYLSICFDMLSDSTGMLWYNVAKLCLTWYFVPPLFQSWVWDNAFMFWDALISAQKTRISLEIDVKS